MRVSDSDVVCVNYSPDGACVKQKLALETSSLVSGMFSGDT